MGFKKISFNNAAARRNDFSGQRNRRRSHDDGGGHFGDQARSFKSVKQAPNEHSTNLYQPRFPSHQDRSFERDNRPGTRFQARSFKPTNPNRHLDQGSRPWHDHGQRHHHPTTNVNDGAPRKFSSIHIEADLQKEVEKLIIEAVENDNRPMPVGILMGKLEGRLQIENFRKVILQTMDELIARKVLKTLPSGKIVIDYIDAPVDLKNTKEGTIFINHKGAGFIKLLNQEVSSYYVHSMNLNDALNGDVVKFAPLIRKSRNELKDAKVLEVLKRNKQEFVGLVFKTHEQDQINFYLKPDDEKVSRQFLIVNPKGLVAGHKVLTRILKFGADEAQCEVLQVLGHENDVGVDISSIVYDHGIKPEFESPVLAQVGQLNLDLERARQQKMRVDLRSLNFITIDPATFKW